MLFKIINISFKITNVSFDSAKRIYKISRTQCSQFLNVFELTNKIFKFFYVSVKPLIYLYSGLDTGNPDADRNNNFASLFMFLLQKWYCLQ